MSDHETTLRAMVAKSFASGQFSAHETSGMLAGAEALRLVRKFVQRADHLPACEGWRGPDNEQWHTGACDCLFGEMRALLTETPR